MRRIVFSKWKWKFIHNGRWLDELSLLSEKWFVVDNYGKDENNVNRSGWFILKISEFGSKSCWILIEGWCLKDMHENIYLKLETPFIYNKSWFLRFRTVYYIRCLNYSVRFDTVLIFILCLTRHHYNSKLNLFNIKIEKVSISFQNTSAS